MRQQPPLLLLRGRPLRPLRRPAAAPWEARGGVATSGRDHGAAAVPQRRRGLPRGSPGAADASARVHVPLQAVRLSAERQLPLVGPQVADEGPRGAVPPKEPGPRARRLRRLLADQQERLLLRPRAAPRHHHERDLRLPEDVQLQRQAAVHLRAAHRPAGGQLLLRVQVQGHAEERGTLGQLQARGARGERGPGPGLRQGRLHQSALRHDIAVQLRIQDGRRQETRRLPVRLGDQGQPQESSLNSTLTFVVSVTEFRGVQQTGRNT